MTQEEKAKAYDEALKRAKECHVDGLSLHQPVKDVLEYIFPELAESEDELTWLTNYIKEEAYSLSMDIRDNEDRMRLKNLQRSLALLESIKPQLKQGKTALEAIKEEKVDNRNYIKPADKVEPIFRVGDWVVTSYGKVNQVIAVDVDEDLDGFTLDDGTYFSGSWKDDYHLWTIQDAKDGDVLFAENFDNIGGCVFLFKGLDSWKFDAEGDRAIATGYCCTSITESGNTDFGIQGPDCVEIKRVHPATKEQRGLLFQKMHEAGYMWNEEKKELEKIESTRPMLSDFFNAEYERGKADALQSIEWSEEDEKTLNEIFSVAARASLRKSTLFGKSYDYIKWQNWLKSLRDRVQLQPKQEWRRG